MTDNPQTTNNSTVSRTLAADTSTLCGAENSTPKEIAPSEKVTPQVENYDLYILEKLKKFKHGDVINAADLVTINQAYHRLSALAYARAFMANDSQTRNK